jgi:hypothetical protein
VIEVHGDIARSPARIHQPSSLAPYARPVVELDERAGYYGGRYGWPKTDSSESLLKAVTAFEDRANQIEGYPSS